MLVIELYENPSTGKWLFRIIRDKTEVKIPGCDKGGYIHRLSKAHIAVVQLGDARPLEDRLLSLSLSLSFYVEYPWALLTP